MHFSPQTPRDAIPQMLAYAPLNTPFGRSASTRANLAHHHSDRLPQPRLTLDLPVRPPRASGSTYGAVGVFRAFLP